MKSTDQVLSELSARLGKTVTISPHLWINNEVIRHLIIDGEIVTDRSIIDLSYSIANETETD